MQHFWIELNDFKLDWKVTQKGRIQEQHTHSNVRFNNTLRDKSTNGYRHVLENVVFLKNDFKKTKGFYNDINLHTDKVLINLLHLILFRGVYK